MVSVIDQQYHASVAALQSYCAIVGTGGTDPVSRFCAQTLTGNAAAQPIIDAALAALNALLAERAMEQMKGLCVEHH